ncbi:MAG: GntR family transcriptional regulator [Clostridia bacterium]|nr:GntR family transcriptional regulator [Clostridia bacterium]
MIVDGKVKSLEESVYNALREDILEGRLGTGVALTECALAARLGVSRTPIRGALHRLSEEGLVSVTPNRGAVVVGVNAEDLVDIYKIRMRLEGLASKDAAARISAEEKKRLSDSVELSEFYIQKKDTEHLKELDTEFHSIIYKASGNRLLYKTLSELHGNITAYRKLSLSSGDRLERSVREHRDILNAILAGDGELADRLTSLHIEAALENLLKVTKGN